MNAALDPSRLYTVLTKTGLQTKDPVLYQLLYNLIGNIVNMKRDVAGLTNSTTNSTVENISNIIQILGGSSDEGSGDVQYMMLGSSAAGFSPAQVETYVSLRIL